MSDTNRDVVNAVGYGARPVHSTADRATCTEEHIAQGRKRKRASAGGFGGRSRAASATQSRADLVAQSDSDEITFQAQMVKTQDAKLSILKADLLVKQRELSLKQRGYRLNQIRELAITYKSLGMEHEARECLIEVRDALREIPDSQQYNSLMLACLKLHVFTAGVKNHVVNVV